MTERAPGRTGRAIGLTMAVVAALLASVTLMGHRLHTEETVQQTGAADGWAFYQAKNNRSPMYATDAKLAELIGRRPPASASNGAADDVLRGRGDLSPDRNRVVLDCAADGSPLLWKIPSLGRRFGVAVAVVGLRR